LIDGFGVGKRAVELVIPNRVRAELMAPGNIAHRVEIDELIGHVANSAADTALGFDPLTRSQRAQSRGETA
jgi:hypothetical protein